MVWKTFQRFGRFIYARHVSIVTTSATVVVGLVLYDKLKEQRIVHADSRPFSASDTNRNEARDLSNFTLSSSKTGIKWDENWDKRDPKSMVKPPKKQTEESIQEYEGELKMKTPKVTRHLILIRHGQYIDTAVTDEGRILTALGREQAGITGQRLRDLDLDYTRMVSSTMSRAVETADLIHQFLPGLALDRDDVLREGAPIKPEPYHSTWRPESYFFQDGARIEAAFRKYFHRADPDQKGDSVEVIVCHANVIRYFVCRALQFPPEAWLRISLAHTSLTHLMIRPSGRVILKSLGNSGHLPPTKVSYS